MARYDCSSKQESSELAKGNLALRALSVLSNAYCAMPRELWDLIKTPLPMDVRGIVVGEDMPDALLQKLLTTDRFCVEASGRRMISTVTCTCR